ncbi:MAG: metal-dependent hydrolase [Candidatus Hydrothermarchaeota archaeon]|nr:MAG: metal-dependent hydrolase [Candidatus Hydrothermarchaeota archaeon]
MIVTYFFLNLRFKYMVEFTDNHMHLDPFNGLGIEIVKKFERVGGRRIFLVNKTTKDAKIELKDEKSFEKLYDFTIRLAKKVNEETKVKAHAVIGLHPVEVVKLCKMYPNEKVLEVCKKAIDIAVKKIEEGQAIAIGEVGRPHFEVDQGIIKTCNQLLEYIFEKASEIDCAVQLHTERINEDKLKELASLALDHSLKPKRVIKHFSPPLIKECEKLGIFPSIISSKDNIIKAVARGKRFLMESDYIDDLKRPGAVVSPTNIPRVCRYLLEKELITEEELYKIHADYIKEAYGM